MDLSSNDRAEQASPRRLACAACGSEFSCSLTGSCWCSDESFRLPMPGDGSDCLCPACLRKLAQQQQATANARWTVEAILLDMDGTLLDTEKVYFESLVAALNACGYSDGVVALCHAMVGLPGPVCEAMLREHYGAALPLDDINRAFIEHRDRMMRAGLPLKPGTLALLDAIAAAKRPMAIVTSSSRRSAERNLALAGIRDRFETLLTLDDVTHGKPDPALYLKAAAQLGVLPAACIAVEDSNHGVSAAHAAGAITLMVPDIAPPAEETRAKCAAVLPDLNAVLALLQERGAL